MRFKAPKFTDEHRYKHGYTPSVGTDIRKTFERVKKQKSLNQKELDAKVENLPNWRFKSKQG